jgi:hypothetical protein
MSSNNRKKTWISQKSHLRATEPIGPATEPIAPTADRAGSLLVLITKMLSLITKTLSSQSNRKRKHALSSFYLSDSQRASEKHPFGFAQLHKMIFSYVYLVCIEYYGAVRGDPIHTSVGIIYIHLHIHLHTFTYNYIS